MFQSICAHGSPSSLSLQGIISIVYIVGVNPMAQGSSSMMYNPMLMMCQNLYQTSSYSQMGGVGGFPMYNQYLYHYCFVDPQEVSTSSADRGFDGTLFRNQVDFLLPTMNLNISIFITLFEIDLS